jgi:hypothetical protein
MLVVQCSGAGLAHNARRLHAEVNISSCWKQQVLFQPQQIEQAHLGKPLHGLCADWLLLLNNLARFHLSTACETTVTHRASAPWQSECACLSPLDTSHGSAAAQHNMAACFSAMACTWWFAAWHAGSRCITWP